MLQLNHSLARWTSAIIGASRDWLLLISLPKLTAEWRSLLDLQDGVGYGNGNFSWFFQRYNDFIYIDRVIVDEAFQGHGLGRRFYSHVVEWANGRQLRSVVAEVDIEPPNSGSLRFHEKLGFEGVGTRKLPNGKAVSMLRKKL